MKKNFVLDTNVILYDAESIFKFGDNNVIIPITVIEEVDHFKKEMNELGRNARRFSRFLDELRAVQPLNKGVPLETGGSITVVLFNDTAATANSKLKHIDFSVADNRILAVASLLSPGVGRDQQTILITKDTNLRIKADAFGIRAEDYENDKIEFEELYTGMREVEAVGASVDLVHRQAGATVASLGLPAGIEYHPNESFIVKDCQNESHTAICRYDAKHKKLVPIKTRAEAWGLAPRNVEQRFALEMLLNDDIKLVTLVGKAGTGKTLLAVAAGLQKTAEEFNYRKLLVSRPVFPMGRDIGFLPGTIEEKLSPWMQPIHDNVEYLMDNYRPAKSDRPSRGKGSGKGSGRGKGQQQPKSDQDDDKNMASFGSGMRELVEMGFLQVEPLMYIRGRSIPRQYMVVDEAQNLTPHEVKTIITRAGEGTKIVLTGDPYQIDNPFLDASSNGLTYVVERFKQHPIAGHITLTKGERSELAELASNIL